jgi:hypothetical protein
LPVAAATHAGNGRVGVLASPGYVFDSASAVRSPPRCLRGSPARRRWTTPSNAISTATAYPDWIEDANGNGLTGSE